MIINIYYMTILNNYHGSYICIISVLTCIFTCVFYNINIYIEVTIGTSQLTCLSYAILCNNLSVTNIGQKAGYTV